MQIFVRIFTHALQIKWPTTVCVTSVAGCTAGLIRRARLWRAGEGESVQGDGGRATFRRDEVQAETERGAGWGWWNRRYRIVYRPHKANLVWSIALEIINLEDNCLEICWSNLCDSDHRLSLRNKICLTFADGLLVKLQADEKLISF